MITVDKAPTALVGDTLIVNMPDGVSQSRTISATDGDTITVGTAFDVAPEAEAVWTVESESLVAQLFRIVGVKESDDEDSLGFTITGLKHNPSKYGAIDNGTKIETRPTSRIPAATQDPVTNITLTPHNVIHQGIAITVLTIGWDKPDGAVKYSVQWMRNDGNWINAGGTFDTHVDVDNVRSGVYTARVVAYNSMGDPSQAVTSAAVSIEGKTAKPPAPVLTATGAYLQINLKWAFSGSTNVEDTAYTEIVVSNTNSRSDGETLGKFAYPNNTASIMSVGPNEQRWAWGRLIDKSGNVGEWSDAATATALGTNAIIDEINDQVDQLDQDVADAQSAADAAQQSADDAASAAQQVASDLTQEIQDRQDAITAEVSARNTAIGTAINQEVADRNDAIAQEASDRADAVTAEA